MLVSMLRRLAIGHGARQLQRRLSSGREKEQRNQESYLVGSMLGLLALLLAFSFAMGVDRYEERRHLVVQEANAIGTSYLRAQLLDEPHRSRLSKLLVDYTDNRIGLGPGDHAQIQRQLAVNDGLLTEIWTGVTAARNCPGPRDFGVPVLVMFNEVIDLDTERKSPGRSLFRNPS